MPPGGVPGWLRFAHGLSLLLLFVLGLVLVYQSSMWFVSNEGGSGGWLGTAALGLVGGSCVCLALFGQKNKSEGVVAATIVSAFWTVGAAVAFAKENANVIAWTLLASSICQVASSLLGSAIAGRNPLGLNDDEEGDFFNSPSRSTAAAPRNYGALSSFIDPLSVTGRIAPSGSQASLPSNISQPSQSPTTSPQMIGRTPSPFGAHSSPHRLGPVSLASLSAAAATPKETPEDIKQSYKALWEKYDLDT